MTRLAMVIDLNKCVGCLACLEACIRENIARQDGRVIHLPEGNTAYYARTKPVVEKKGEIPGLRFIQCMHCENPPCELVCPTGATYRTPNGIVMLDHSKCIGCRACVIACPYGARTVYRGRLEGPKPNPYALEPGYPDKCTFCIHRGSATSSGWLPACVEACAFGARIFGDLDNRESLVSRIVREGKAIALAQELGTRPKLFFVPPLRSLVERR